MKKTPKGRQKSLHESENNQAQLKTELWQAAVNLRGSIEPADYKRYVLPIIFLIYFR